MHPLNPSGLLTEQQQERISILEAQLRRLRAQLAAHAGHAELSNFLLQRDDGAEYLLEVETQLRYV